jgi:hypothetical protein
MIQISLYEPLSRRGVDLVDDALRQVEANGGMDLFDAVEKLAQRGLRRERAGPALRIAALARFELPTTKLELLIARHACDLGWGS